jgi:hypothetical protein
VARRPGVRAAIAREVSYACANARARSNVTSAAETWAGGLDDEGAKGLAATLGRYFAAAVSVPEADAATDIIRAWRDLLDSAEPSVEPATMLHKRAMERSGGTAWTELQLGLAAWIRWHWGGPFEFDYKLTGTGWSEGFVAQGDHWLRPTASYLTDALRALVTAVVALLEGKEHVACIWEEEPGEYLWLFDRDADLVDLRITWREHWSAVPSGVDTWFVPVEGEKGDQKLRLRASPEAIGRGVLAALDRLVVDPGSAEYRRRWGKPFPETEHRKLRELVGAL